MLSNLFPRLTVVDCFTEKPIITSLFLHILNSFADIKSCVIVTLMGVGCGSRGVVALLVIHIHGTDTDFIFYGTDKVEGGLMVLFFDLVFSVAPTPSPPENFSPDAFAALDYTVTSAM